MKPSAFTLGFFLVLVACGQEAAQRQPVSPLDVNSAQTEPAKGITWFDGSVDEAFAAAKEMGKPLFLYWSAEWCPPCHVVKETIFSKPEFIERSKLFVTVYLDGDAENGQAYGEKFGVYGYPTIIVYNSEGQEITRIFGGVDIQAYANILDLTLAATSPTRSLVQALMNGESSLSASECSLLAYYAWDQDPALTSDLDLRDGFRRMYEACPDQLDAERSILYLSWLSEFEDTTAISDGKESLTSEERAEALGTLSSVLGSPNLARANIYPLILDGVKYASLLTEPGSEEREQLVARFDDAFNAIAADESIHKRERIYTLLGKINFERIEDEDVSLSDDLVQEIRDMVVWANESTLTKYERQPVISAVSGVLAAADMDEIAKPLLLAELQKSKQPYYFMLDLADIEQRAGNDDAALDWLKSAHESTKGPATRFQWGLYYLRGLLEMTPEDSQTIQDTTVALVTELLQESGGFYAMPKAQLKWIEGELLEWAGDKNDLLSNIRSSVQHVCQTLPEQDSTCETFLDTG